MRKALDLMEGDRLLTRRQGRGTFVNDQSSDELAMRFTNIRGENGERVIGDVRTSDLAESTASETECRRLKLRAEDAVYRVRRVRSQQSKPFMVEDVVLPVALFPGLAQRKVAALRIISLAQEFGILLGKAQESIRTGTASADVAATLNLAPDSPVLRLDRIIMTLDGRPAEWRVAHCHLGGKHYLAEIA
jgi:GntR family transcriptional regulator